MKYVVEMWIQGEWVPQFSDASVSYCLEYIQRAGGGHRRPSLRVVEDSSAPSSSPFNLCQQP